MREDFLHYIWSTQQFNLHGLKTVCNKDLSIISSGKYTTEAGADFQNAHIYLDKLHWYGHIEIHTKSSEWYNHNHHTDPKYNNVILHVVWEYDVDIFVPHNVIIPTLELKSLVNKQLNEAYMNLKITKNWILCESSIHQIPTEIIDDWKKKLILERLHNKSKEIQQLLHQTNNNWEAVLFYTLAKNFGLNTNGIAFLEIVKNIGFAIFRKEITDLENIEALLFGMGGLLEGNFEDTYALNLKQRWEYLQAKYQINPTKKSELVFFQHRPDNFPTIRLAQIAMLLYTKPYLFDDFIKTTKLTEFYSLLDLNVSPYWKKHYIFDKKGTEKNKKLSKNFIDLLLINTIIPFKYTFDQFLEKDTADDMIALLSSIKSEKNATIDRFDNLGILSENAFDSQSLLHLKKEYCNPKRCLDCQIGRYLLENPL
ncbi:MAG: DUF2851 family protein [Bacteroidota bacterium]|nr:DUF2851 family protein [Bacteroidota bacterium]